MSNPVAAPSDSPPPPITETLQYYEDHRKLIQALKQKKDDIDYGRMLFALIYSKQLLKDPMLATLELQQKLLPVKEDVEDDGQGVFSHKLDMSSDLEKLGDLAETFFNTGASITDAQADKFASLLLFLTAIPFADDLNSTVISMVQDAMTHLATKVFNCGPIPHDKANWAGRIKADQIYLFNSASTGGTHEQTCMEQIKFGFDDFDQSSQALTSSGKMLQNAAKQSVNDEKTQLGGYNKMADMQTRFERAVNRAGEHHA